VDNLNIRLQNTQTAQNRLQNELNQTNSDLEAQRNSMDDLGQSAEENQERFREFGERLSEMGKAAAVGIAAIAAAFLATGTAGVKMSDDLTKSLNGLQVGTGASDEAMAGMKETIIDIYNSNLGENFEDIGRVMTEVGKQTGATGEELKGLTKNALLVRDAFGFEVNESIRTVDMMMKQFGISGDEAFNLIAQGAQAGLDKNGNLLDSINEYSVHFEQLGFDSEEMFNMMANGAKSGVFDIDKLGDAMKEFGIRSKDGSKASAEGFQALGLDAGKMTESFAQGGDTAKEAFDKTVKALFEIESPLAREAAGVALFGTQWEDVGAKGIEALVNSQGEVDKTEDALQKINDVNYSSFGQGMEGIKRHLETGILIPLGDKALPTLQKFQTWIITNMPAIQNEISYAFDTIGTAITNAATTVKGIIDWFVKYKDIITPIVAAISLVIINAWAVTTAKAVASAAVHAAQTAIVVAKWLWMGVQSEIHALKVAGSWIVAGAGAVKTAVIHVAQTAVIVAKWLWMGVQSGIHALKVVASWVVTGAGAIAAGIVMVAQSALVVAKWVWMGAQSLIHAAKMAAAWVIAMGPVAWVTIAIVALAALIIANWEKIKEKTSEIFGNIATWLSDTWNSIKTDIATKVDNIKTDLFTRWDEIKTNISTKITDIKTELSNKWNEIKTDISTKIGEIKTSISTKWGEIKTTASTEWGKIKTAITQPIEDAKTAISNILEKIRGFFNNFTVPDVSVKVKWGGPGDAIPYPSFDVDWVHWNAEGGIFTRPTLLGGGQGVGEAGAEAVLPISRLDGIVASALVKANKEMGLTNGNGLALNIENFVNNRKQDIEELMAEMEFYRRRDGAARGW